MNNLTFLIAMIGLLGAAIPAVIFLQKSSVRVRRLRSVFGRVCVQITPDQTLAYPDSRLQALIDHIIHKEVDALTAVDFLDDPSRERSMIEWIGGVSPSLFFTPIVRLVGLAHALAFVIASFAVGALSLLPPLSDWIKAVASSSYGLALIVGLAAGVGVFISALFSMVVWSIFFERDLADTLSIVEHQSLWSVGAERRPGRRTIVLPKDDPVYSALKG